MVFTTLRSIAFSGIVTLCLSGLAIAPTFAQNNSSRSEFPGRRVGGGTRSGYCEANSHSLVALSPVNNLGITARKTPTLYFALPDLEDTYTANFFLQDTAGKIVYQTSVETQNTQRFVSIHLPADSLVTNQDHQWYFALVCDPSQSVTLSGWLRQVESVVEPVDPAVVSLNHQLEQVNRYQASGLWSDAIATMVTLYQADPHNPAVQAAWTQLLEALKLQPFVKPIVALEDQM